MQPRSLVSSLVSISSNAQAKTLSFGFAHRASEVNGEITDLPPRAPVRRISAETAGVESSPSLPTMTLPPIKSLQAVSFN